MRDLGPATRLDNTRARSLSGRASRASQQCGRRTRIGGGSRVRHRGKVRGRCSGKVRAVALGAAVRAAAARGAATAAMAAGRARAGAARNRPTSRSCCGAARTASGACCRAAFGTGTGIAVVVLGDRRHLAGERLLPRAARRGRRRSALWRLQSDDPAGPQLPPAGADRVGADAERHPRQPDRNRLPQRRRPDAAGSQRARCRKKR